MNELDSLRQSVIDGNIEDTENLMKQALAAGLPPEQILNEGLISAMARVGQLFEEGSFYISEMLIAALAMKAGLGLLRPGLAAANVKAVGKVVIGTVQGDLHDIGKNLVAMMLEGAGFEVIDLGVDVPPRKFVEAVEQHTPQFVGLSTLLTTTMPRMKTTIEALKEAGLRDRVKVVIGGAPVTEEYARSIEADLYAPDAPSAATRVRQLLVS